MRLVNCRIAGEMKQSDRGCCCKIAGIKVEGCQTLKGLIRLILAGWKSQEMRTGRPETGHDLLLD